MTKVALAGALQPVLAKDALLVNDKQPDLPRLFAGRAPRARGGQSQRRHARQWRHPCPERQRLSRLSQTVAAPLSRRCHGLSGQQSRLVSLPGLPPWRLWASCLGDSPGKISTFNSDIAIMIDWFRFDETSSRLICKNQGLVGPPYGASILASLMTLAKRSVSVLIKAPNSVGPPIKGSASMASRRCRTSGDFRIS
jgi:hypothetical protein